MFGMLVVVLRRDGIAILRFSTRQRQISFIASLQVLKASASGRDVGDIQRFGRAANGRAVATEFLLFRISRSLIGTRKLRAALSVWMRAR
jgi:hypothetical protein